MRVLEPKDRYYSVREVAKILEVSPGRVHHFISEKRLNAQKIGNILVVSEQEIQRFRQIRRQPGRPKSIA